MAWQKGERKCNVLEMIVNQSLVKLVLGEVTKGQSVDVTCSKMFYLHHPGRAYRVVLRCLPQDIEQQIRVLAFERMPDFSPSDDPIFLVAQAQKNNNIIMSTLDS